MKFSFAHLNPFGRTRAAEEDEEKPEGAPPENEEDEAAAASDEEEEEPAGSAEEGGEDGEGGEEEEEQEEAQAGRQQERARWATVLSSPQAAGRVETACTLLATTDLSAEQVIGTLKAVPAAAQGRGNPLALQQMDRQPPARVGASGGSGAQSADERAAQAVLSTMSGLGMIRAPRKEKK